MNKNKLLIWFLICVMLILQIPISAFAEKTADNIPETQGDCYLLDSTDDLYWFSDYVNENGSGKAKLTADITINADVSFSYDETTGKIKVEKDGITSYLGSGLSETERGKWYGSEIELKEWKPIGRQVTDVGYTVTFDGNGHTVDGIYAVGSEQAPFAGFFANLFQGDIRNLTIGEHSLIINNYAVTSDGYKGATGGIAARTHKGDIKNCKNYALVCGTSSSTAEWYGGTGGIAGVGASRIANCENYGTILGSGSAGGIAGTLVNNKGSSAYGDTEISNCVNKGDVFADMSAYSRAGGIAGIASYDYSTANAFGGRMFYSFNYGRVSGGYASGITAHMASDSTVLNCGNFGEITGAVCAAGLCSYVANGYGSAGTLAIQKSFNAGVIKINEKKPENLGNTERIASPIFTNVQKASLITVSNCYNDNTVFPCEVNYKTEVTMSKSSSVETEVFASGEPAFYMKMKQELSVTETEGKTPQIYPDETSESNVFKLNRYCCHTDDTNKEAHKTVVFSNGRGDIVDEHTPDENGICSHCEKDVRPPRLSADALEKGKVANYYYMQINANSDSTPVTFSLTNSETDDTEYTLPDGLSGTANCSYSQSLKKYLYYYVISGKPQTAGTYNFVLKATNEYGTTATPYTLVIEKADTLVITTDEKLNNATVGESYNAYIWKNLSLDGVWSVAEGSSLPNGLSINEKDGTISGIPTVEGNYSFTITVSCAGQTASKTFFLTVLEEGGCKHRNINLVKGIAATCTSDGRADYYHCETCGCDYEDEKGENEIWDIRQLTTAKNHTDADKDGLCDYCNKPMPIFKKVTNESEIMTASTYVLAAEINGEQYLLTYPSKSEGSALRYGDYMPSAKAALQSDNTFSFSSLADAGVMMLTPEFAAENGNLDAGLPRYGLNSVIGGIRYGLMEGGAGFDMYPNDPAKYGYRLALDENGAVKLASVYSEYWGEEKVGNGLLLAFDMNYNGESTKFFTFHTESDYNGEKANYEGATITEYPVYLYRMVYVDSIGGKTYTTNDDNANFTADGNLRDFYAETNAGLSNVSGISNSVSRETLQNAVAEAQTDDNELFVSTYAHITATSREHEDDGKTDKTTSLGFSITPYINITDLSGNSFDKELANSDLCDAPITVTLCVGDLYPEQIIHYKKDGTKEYFYPEYSEQAENGAKTFTRESDNDGNTYITFTITDFSDFKILASAEDENSYENKISYDYKTLNITCAKAGEYTLVFANYDKIGKMTDIKTLTRKFTQGENVIDALPDGVSLKSGSKILLWESFGTLKPLCSSFTVE